MRALLYETRTGRPLMDLERVSWEYDTGILAADEASVAVPGYTTRAQQLDLRQLLTPKKHSIALIDDSVLGETVVPAAGYIAAAPAVSDPDGRHVYDVRVQGVERLFERRHIRLFPGWPLVNSRNLPTGTYNPTWRNLEYGTIMKRMVVESMKWPGGDLPIDFEPDRSGTRERTYDALDGKSVLEAMDDIADVLGGVEYDFQPYLDANGWVRFRFATGADADGRIVGPVSPTINIGGRRQDADSWEREPVASDVATDAYFTGGKEDDKVMVARAVSTELIDQGWPRIEEWDSSHSSVSRQATLQGWANGRLQGITEQISFRVRAARVRGLRHGDVVNLAARGHWDMPDGLYQRRVLSVARESGSENWVSITLVGVVT